jgi:hypothetical protein
MQNTLNTAVTTKQIITAVKEQMPEMLYLFEKPKKKLSYNDKAYRTFLKNEVLRNIKL